MSQIRGILGRRGRDDIVSARFREAILNLADPFIASTRCIEEIEAGHLQKWADMPAPAIAIDYWRLAPDAKLLDVIYAVRSDESTHRFVNHSLANLNPSKDVNPFAFREPNMFVKGTKVGWVFSASCGDSRTLTLGRFERSEAERFVQESHDILSRGTKVPEIKH